jgi:hypothetical protein
MVSSLVAVIFNVCWPLLAGVVSEHLFRRLTIWTGKKFPLSEEEKQMNIKKFLKHIDNERLNDKT